MVANRERGEVEVKLDRPRVMRIGLTAMARAETALGGPIQEVFKADRVGANQILVVLWAGLLRDDPNLKVEDVEDLVWQADGATFADKWNGVVKKVLEAMELVGLFGKAEKSADEGNPQTVPGPSGPGTR